MKNLFRLSILTCACFLFLLVINSCGKKNSDDDCPACPAVTSISPASGHAYDTITIYGKNFSSNFRTNTVKINGVQIEADSIIDGNSGMLKVKIPKGCGSGRVTVDVDQDLTNFGTPPYFQYLLKVTTFAVIDSFPPSAYSYPAGITFDNQGKLWLTKSYSLHQYNVQTRTSTWIWGDTNQTVVNTNVGYLNSNGAIKCDASGQLFFTSGNNPSQIGGMILKWNTAYPEPVAGAWNLNGNLNAAVGTSASFSFPWCLAITETNLYTRSLCGSIAGMFSPTQLRKIQKASPNATETLRTDTFDNIAGMTIGSDGKIYFSLSNFTGSCIYRVNQDGSNLELFAGSNLANGTTDDVSRLNARFNAATCIAFGPGGNLFVMDQYRVRCISPDGMVSSLRYSDGTYMNFGIFGSIAYDQNNSTIYIVTLNQNVYNFLIQIKLE